MKSITKRQNSDNQQNMAYNNNSAVDINSKVPIRKGCSNKSCFCTGACNEIIRYRERLPNERMALNAIL